MNRSGRGERKGRGADGTAIRPRIYAFRADKWPGHGHGDVSDSQQAIRSARLFCIIRIVYARIRASWALKYHGSAVFNARRGGGPHSLRASTSASSLFRRGHPIECRGTPALSEGALVTKLFHFQLSTTTPLRRPLRARNRAQGDDWGWDSSCFSASGELRGWHPLRRRHFSNSLFVFSHFFEEINLFFFFFNTVRRRRFEIFEISQVTRSTTHNRPVTELLTSTSPLRKGLDIRFPRFNDDTRQRNPSVCICRATHDFPKYFPRK